MNQSMILPPFPFVEKWDAVRQQHGLVYGLQWFVPGLPLTQCPKTGADAHPDFNAPKEPTFTEHEAPCDLDDQVHGEDYVLQLNPVWAAQFAKTAARRQARSHKRQLKTTLEREHHTSRGFGNYSVKVSGDVSHRTGNSKRSSNAKRNQTSVVTPTRSERLLHQASVVAAEQNTLREQRAAQAQREEERTRLFGSVKNLQGISALEARLNRKFDKRADQLKPIWWPETALAPGSVGMK